MFLNLGAGTYWILVLATIAAAILGSRNWRKPRPGEEDRPILPLAWMRWYWVAAILLCVALTAHLRTRAEFPLQRGNLLPWHHGRQPIDVVAFLATIAFYPFVLGGYLKRRARGRREAPPPTGRPDGT